MSTQIIALAIGFGFIALFTVLFAISDGHRAAVRFAVLGVLVVLGVWLLAGCGTPASDPGDASGDFRVAVVELDDGREVTCITWSTGGTKAGGLSCDWEGAR